MDKKDNRKKQIMYVALKSFCKVGFDATKIDDISEKAEISHGLMYHYFKTKEAIFWELFHDGQIVYSQTMDATILNDNLTPSEKLLQLVNLLLEKIEHDETFVLQLYFIFNLNLIKKDFAKIFKKQLGKISDTAKQAFLEKTQNVQKAYLNIFKSGVESKQFADADVKAHFTLFNATLEGLVMNKVRSLFFENKNFVLPTANQILRAFLN